MESWGKFGTEPEDHKPDLTYLNGQGPSYPSPLPALDDPYTMGWNQGQSAGVNGNGLNTHRKCLREEDGNGYRYGNGGENSGKMALAEEVGFVMDPADDPVVHSTPFYFIICFLLMSVGIDGTVDGARGVIHLA